MRRCPRFMSTGRSPGTSQSQVTDDEYTPHHYHRLARIMGREKNLAIFRRFDEINLLQLMTLLAEIVELKGRFAASYQEDDAASLMYSRSFHEFRSQQRNMRVESDRESSSNTDSKEMITDGSVNASSTLQCNLLRDLRDRIGRVYKGWT